MGRPAVFGAADASERASEMFLRTGAFFSSILSEFLKNLVALHYAAVLLWYNRHKGGIAHDGTTKWTDGEDGLSSGRTDFVRPSP